MKEIMRKLLLLREHMCLLPLQSPEVPVNIDSDHKQLCNGNSRTLKSPTCEAWQVNLQINTLHTEN